VHQLPALVSHIALEHLLPAQIDLEEPAIEEVRAHHRR
jgi:hypothetical protein